MDFYPRSPRGERRTPKCSSTAFRKFLSTLPARGATNLRNAIAYTPNIFLSTLPARGATVLCDVLCHLVKAISIHAPREGSDTYDEEHLPVIDKFLSTLPARGATCSTENSAAGSRFLSTLPARGATLIILWYNITRRDFYPRSPRGERRTTTWKSGPTPRISIHAPREGSDGRQPVNIPLGDISIHAPREGSDISMQLRKISAMISIHAPREGSDL